VFPTATTSPFSTATGAAVTTLLVRLSATILGGRQARLFLLLLLGEEHLVVDGDRVGRRHFLTVVHRLEPPCHLLDGQG
jgi:hypothetical protein